MGILNPLIRALCFAAITTLIITSPAAAQDLSPVTNFFNTIGTALTGTVGRAIGLVALAAVGLLFMTGNMNWRFAASITIGLVILFGAATILAGF